MPWVISLLFHVGIFLILLFIVMIVLRAKEPETPIIADAHHSEDPGGRMNPGAVTKVTTQSKRKAKRKFTRNESVSTDASKTDTPLDIISAAGGAAGGSMADVGMSGAGSGAGPRSDFFKSGGNAHNVVYVIDRSGSMIDTFDSVRWEMVTSISELRDSHTFHIIMFATGKPIQLDIAGARRPYVATRANRKEAARFLADDVRAEGQTDPVPALQQAFGVLQRAKQKGKLIYLLTDGIFPDNEKVLNAIRSANSGGDVVINTFLYGNRPPEAVDVMETIADENGGSYRYVPSEGY
jgi:Mg-chelatase subunit ChlD